MFLQKQKKEQIYISFCKKMKTIYIQTQQHQWII
jgi:hypothetical protein